MGTGTGAVPPAPSSWAMPSRRTSPGGRHIVGRLMAARVTNAEYAVRPEHDSAASRHQQIRAARAPNGPQQRSSEFPERAGASGYQHGRRGRSDGGPGRACQAGRPRCSWGAPTTRISPYVNLSPESRRWRGDPSVDASHDSVDDETRKALMRPIRPTLGLYDIMGTSAMDRSLTLW